MRTCLFCDGTSLTLEHVWPDWISKHLYGQPKHGRFTARRFEGVDRHAVGDTFKASELNIKARVVCASCNNGWMSELEAVTQPVLKPLLLGDSMSLDDLAQTTLRAWIVLRAMILERSGPAITTFYTEAERRAFAHTSLEPKDGTYIWVFQYQNKQWAARSNIMNGGLHMVRGGPQTNRLQVITAFVGRFGFQVLVARWPKRRRLDFDSLAVRTFATPLASLWPDPNDVLDWPPRGFYLGNDAYEPLLDRFTKGGFPLQRRQRRR